MSDDLLGLLGCAAFRLEESGWGKFAAACRDAIKRIKELEAELSAANAELLLWRTATDGTNALAPSDAAKPFPSRDEMHAILKARSDELKRGERRGDE